MTVTFSSPLTICAASWLPFARAHVGMVTCPYRGIAANTLGSKLESIGISTDFIAGVLVARQLENGIHFALGSTLAMSRTALDAIGGLRPLGRLPGRRL